MVALALVLGAIGLLRGFGMLGDTAETVGAEATDVQFAGQFSDALLWMIPGISAGLLAMALHMNGHHRTNPRTERARENNESGLFNLEHGLAMVMSVATIAAGALCLLVGFDTFDRDYTVNDGILWGLASIITGASTVALHSVGHHQLATDEDYLISIVEQRAAGMPGATRTTTATRPTSETTRR
jgi:hypothetical protein